MKVKIRNKILFKFISVTITFSIILCGCNGVYPAESPQNMPQGSDAHTHLFTYAFHKPNYRYPYGYDSVSGGMNCARSTCHQADLRGGIASFFIGDSVHHAIAPSCYQCHGKIWFDIDSIIVK